MRSYNWETSREGDESHLENKKTKPVLVLYLCSQKEKFRCSTIGRSFFKSPQCWKHLIKETSKIVLFISSISSTLKVKNWKKRLVRLIIQTQPSLHHYWSHPRHNFQTSSHPMRRHRPPLYSKDYEYWPMKQTLLYIHCTSLRFVMVFLDNV